MRALRTSLFFASLSLVGFLPAHADLLVNGGFETGSFSGWTVSAGATFVSTSGFAGYNAHSGNYFAALGNVGGLGTLSQTFSDTPGQSYTLTYYLASNGTVPNEFKVQIDGNTLYDSANIPGTSPSSPYAYDPFSFTFTGTGSDTLTFFERNDPSYLALDDVSINPTGITATPEPSSLVLLVTGAAGLAGAVRRKMRAL